MDAVENAVRLRLLVCSALDRDDLETARPLVRLADEAVADLKPPEMARYMEWTPPAERSATPQEGITK